MKTNINFKGKAWNRPPQSAGPRNLFYPKSIKPKILIEESGNLKHPKNINKYQ